MRGEGKDGRIGENKSIKKRRNSAKPTEKRAYILNAGILYGKRGAQVPPICHYCNNALMTVKHLQVCLAFEGERRWYR